MGRGKFPLLLISQELLALLRAGISLVEACEALAEKEQNTATKAVLDQLLAALYSGKTLSVAMEAAGPAFPALFVATIRASERTSSVDQALERFIGYQVKIDEIRKKVVNAMIYPVLLMGVGGLVTVFLLGYVVPRFSQIFEERGTGLPLLTRLLMDWGGLLNQYAWQSAVAFAGAVAAAIFALSQPAVRAWFGRQFWQLPYAGDKMHLYQLARLYRTLAMLLQGGMPMVAAMDMVKELLAPTLRPGFEAAARAIREGRTISEAMAANGLSTPVANRMLRVGEQTGNMGGMMEQIAAFYDEDLARTAEVFTRTFEPVLMTVIGLVIGGVVLLMYMPIFELASSIE